MNPYLDQALEHLTTAAGGMPPERMQRAPQGKWCVAEILKHLSMTYTSTMRAMQKQVADPKPVRKPSMKERVAIGYVCGLLRIPSGRKAPEYAQPQGVDAETIVLELRTNILAMDEAIERAEKAYPPGERIAVHPIIGPLTAVQWRRFHLAHARHHARQITALRNWVNSAGQSARAAT